MTRAFIGFDLDVQQTSGLSSTANSVASASAWNARWIPPVGVYHNKGVATLDLSQIPPNSSLSSSGSFIDVNGRKAGAAYGNGNGGYNSLTGYGGATNTSRAVYVTAQGHQLGIVRSMIGHSNSELWLNMDIKFSTMPTSSMSAHTPANSWQRIFKWGDVEVLCKETVYTSTHSVVLSIRNNAVEVSTVTIPLVPTSAVTSAADATWYHFALYVKLDATTGAIQLTVNGIAQSPAYTNQNTVQSTALASATIIYIGPPVFDSGTVAYVGLIDHVHLDDAAFTTGRISVEPFTVSTGTADILNTDFVNWTTLSGTPGTGTLLAGSLASQLDNVAVRGTSNNAKLYVPKQFTNALTSYSNEVIGVEIAVKRVANRNPVLDRRVQVGIYESVTGESLGTTLKSIIPGFDSSIVIPTTVGISAVEQIFRKSDNTRLTKTELGSTTAGSGVAIVLKSSAP